MGMYRKKPVVIEAMLFDGSVDQAHDILDWITAGGGVARTHDVYERPMKNADGSRSFLVGGIHIETLEGVMNASDGDWIIKGVQGEFYPCKPDIFAATYEAVE